MAEFDRGLPGLILMPQKSDSARGSARWQVIVHAADVQDRDVGRCPYRAA